MARFDKFHAEKSVVPQTNGHTKKEESSQSPTVPKQDSPPAKKKYKRESSDELSDLQESPAPKKKRKIDHDSDAAYAAKLQAQENGRIRSTRGGGSKKASLGKKKSPKKKTASKVKAEDDSDLEGSGSEAKEKKVNRSGGFHVSITGLYAPSARKYLHFVERACTFRTFISTP